MKRFANDDDDDNVGEQERVHLRRHLRSRTDEMTTEEQRLASAMRNSKNKSLFGEIQRTIQTLTMLVAVFESATPPTTTTAVMPKLEKKKNVTAEEFWGHVLPAWIVSLRETDVNADIIIRFINAQVDEVHPKDDPKTRRMLRAWLKRVSEDEVVQAHLRTARTLVSSGHPNIVHPNDGDSSVQLVADVTGTTRRSYIPHFVQIRVGGDELLDNADNGSTEHGSLEERSLEQRYRTAVNLLHAHDNVQHGTAFLETITALANEADKSFHRCMERLHQLFRDSVGDDDAADRAFSQLRECIETHEKMRTLRSSLVTELEANVHHLQEVTDRFNEHQRIANALGVDIGTIARAGGPDHAIKKMLTTAAASGAVDRADTNVDADADSDDAQMVDSFVPSRNVFQEQDDERRQQHQRYRSYLPGHDDGDGRTSARETPSMAPAPQVSRLGGIINRLNDNRPRDEQSSSQWASSAFHAFR